MKKERGKGISMDKKFSLTILMIHNYYQSKGGEDTVAENEKKMLEEQGHRVIFYSKSNNDIKQFGIWERLLLPIRAVFSLETYFEVKEIIKKEKVDILHIHNTLTLISPSVYHAAFACKVPVVQTLHNFRLICPSAVLFRKGNVCEECIRHGLGRSIKHRCYRSSYAQTVVSAAILKIHRWLRTYYRLHYICLTEFNKNKILEVNSLHPKIFNKKKFYVKPNFTTWEQEIIPFGERKKQFVFAGRMDKIKGIFHLLEAWKDIKQYDLIICGTGPEEEGCRKFVLDNKMENVKFQGLISNQAVMDIVSESRGFILLTNWYEGFPMSLVESFACGTPVIGSDFGNVGNIIKEGVTGIKVSIDSKDDLINAVLSISDMTESCRKEYELYYNSEVNYKNLMGIYQDIISKSG